MAVYYVKAGSGGDGSEANPFGTVAAAEAVAKPGDKIVDGARQWRVRGPGRTPVAAPAPSAKPPKGKAKSEAEQPPADDFR